MKKFFVGSAVFMIAMVILGITLFSGIVMLLWNNILPHVLHVGIISIWQAAGILLLARILFGGRRHRHGGRKMYHRTAWRHRGCSHTYVTAE